MNAHHTKLHRHYFSRRGIFLAVVVVICVLPFIWTVLASIQIWPVEVSTPPQWVVEPSLDQYLEVGIAHPEFISELLTSAILAACTTLLATGLAFFSAYSIARSRFRGRTLLVQSFLILASLPVISFLIPLSNILDALRLTNTFTGILLAETTLFVPLAVYVLFGYFNSVSIELEESARLDGATLLQTLRTIVLPVSLPGIAATAIIIFVLSWNQVLVPLILAAPVRTIPTAMIDFFTFERELEWPSAAAALIVSLLPLALVVAAAHRPLERFSLDISQHKV
jgi:multiple sugar transport system permease protein